MTIYVVLHHNEVNYAFKKKEDALEYVSDDVDVDEIYHVSEVGANTDGEWRIEECTLS